MQDDVRLPGHRCGVIGKHSIRPWGTIPARAPTARRDAWQAYPQSSDESYHVEIEEDSRTRLEDAYVRSLFGSPRAAADDALPTAQATGAADCLDEPERRAESPPCSSWDGADSPFSPSQSRSECGSPLRSPVRPPPASGSGLMGVELRSRHMPRPRILAATVVGSRLTQTRNIAATKAHERTVRKGRVRSSCSHTIVSPGSVRFAGDVGHQAESLSAERGEQGREALRPGVHSRRSVDAGTLRPGSAPLLRWKRTARGGERANSPERQKTEERSEGQQVARSDVVQMKTEGRFRKEQAALRIQARFRGILARQRIEILRREDARLHDYGLRVAEVVCGGCPFNHTVGHAAALTKSGKVFTWGSAKSGQLGIRSLVDTPVPLLVGHCKRCNPEARFSDAGLLADKNVTRIAVGGSHTLALTEEGQVYSWGSSGHGQSGQGRVSYLEGDTDPMGLRIPPLHESAKDMRKFVPVLIARLSRIKSIACGRYHSLAVTTEGHLFTWGEIAPGRLDVRGATEVWCVSCRSGKQWSARKR